MPKGSTAMDEERPKRPGEVVFACCLLLASLGILQQAYGISGLSSLSSAGFFPMLAGAVMVVSAATILVGLLRTPGWSAVAPTDVAVRFVREILPPLILVFVALIAGYMVALEPVGFLASSFVFLILAVGILRRRDPLLVLAVSAGSLGIIFLVFRYVFTVMLP
jgi:putative tricarboxylic transport membrane protein